jgi:uroporphyrinogen-III synthase
MAPVLRIVRLTPDLPPPDTLQAILVTSANALDCLPDAYRTVRLLAVGAATGAAAERTGFARVECADGDADALAEYTARVCVAADGKLLLASGMGNGAALAAALDARGFTIERRDVYAARPVERLDEAATEALRHDRVRAALFFSAETARVFVRLAQQGGFGVRDIDAVAIAGHAAMALERLPWRAIRTARRPTQDEMLALLR